jgi:hypothetical protein
VSLSFLYRDKSGAPEKEKGYNDYRYDKEVCPIHGK